MIIYPTSGTRAWEATLVNTLSAGDTVLMIETGNFANLWCKLAARLGMHTELLKTDWRRDANPEAIEARLAADKRDKVKAVCVVRNETSTGAMSRISDIRAAIDAAQHDTLLMVDTISSLDSSNHCHEAWDVDVTIAGSQKGLMFPPDLSFNAFSKKARQAAKTADLPGSY